MMRRNVRWEEGTWTRSPQSVYQDGGHLIVTAEKESDYWRHTLYGFVHDNGHALLSDWNKESAVEVTFRLESFTQLYDQAGILLYRGEEQWIKAGIEMNDGVPCLAIVVTDGFSDWSLTPVPDWDGEEVTIRASIINDGVIIRARSSRHGWQTVRVARFPYPEGIKAGPMVCSPVGDSLQVTFTRWEWTEADRELHADPPL
ncbi:hypothetical protein A7K91_05605 [Paenibacillus oryzae]|uniref:DUF1349 domain-containing protein n=1 Tax=Paenibacillus oryzae TaxID=1844972 RepID=A0A1A5YHL3_9BACL|nr:DUF1349 domain-containing protein [Paenibacillus oryzae]OBR65038.1 hypothetical protein A7K91_05605 [Paenibacillus oryzae]